MANSMEMRLVIDDTHNLALLKTEDSCICNVRLKTDSMSGMVAIINTNPSILIVVLKT